MPLPEKILKRSTLYSLALLVATFLVIIGGVEAFCRYRLDLVQPRCQDEDLWFELRTLITHGQGNIEYDTHPTRGWTPKTHLDLVGDPTIKTTTNNRGMRATPEYAFHPEKFTVMVLGDSFTYGAGADDREVWTNLLQGMDDRLQVLNLAAGGYGIDQMYITMHETIDDYKPQLVVFAYTDGDLTRALLYYREMRKLRFVIDQKGELTLTNVPIGSREDTYSLMKAKYALPKLISFVMLKDQLAAAIKGRPNGQEASFELGTKIFEAAASCAKEHDADFLLTRLAAGCEINNPNEHDAGEGFLDTFRAAHGGPVLNTHPAFAAAGRSWTEGHYKGPEAAFAAGLVYAKIQELPSWRRFVSQPNGNEVRRK